MSDPDADFLDMLQVGVPLGVNQPLHPSTAWPINSDHTSEPIPLQDCTSAWKSARDHHSLVQELVQDEVQSGFVAHVPGGLQELKSKFKRAAAGKLGVVIAEGRAPRLVVDSSISSVTADTVLPNHMLLPRINDVIRCTPTAMSQDQLIQLTLDASKAHRRILIHPEDQGMLCFHVGDQLYRCLTLNFGARASGFYWSPVAGLMVRFLVTPSLITTTPCGSTWMIFSPGQSSSQPPCGLQSHSLHDSWVYHFPGTRLLWRNSSPGLGGQFVCAH